MLGKDTVAGPHQQDPWQAALCPLTTVDPLSHCNQMLRETAMENNNNLGIFGCSEGICPHGAVWPLFHKGPTADPVLQQEESTQPWHSGCLCCDGCHSPWTESSTHFQKNGRALCEKHDEQIFTERCLGCGLAVLATDLIVRVGTDIYHPDCLQRPPPGDSFSAEAHRKDPERHKAPEQKGHKGHSSTKGSGTDRRGRILGHWLKRGRRVRVRTVLSDSQLGALCSCYAQTPRPDMAVKLRLGQLTGLSPRVIRVWFQNKRCKDKKSRAKEDCRTEGDDWLHSSAKPMVVLSPEAPDSALQICVYESPWEKWDSELSAYHDDLLLTEALQNICSSGDLDSTHHQLSDDDTITLLTI